MFIMNMRLGIGGWWGIGWVGRSMWSSISGVFCLMNLVGFYFLISWDLREVVLMMGVVEEWDDRNLLYLFCFDFLVVVFILGLDFWEMWVVLFCFLCFLVLRLGLVCWFNIMINMKILCNKYCLEELGMIVE